jgi:bifunctional UDP-N-acetylglucosamine pyrophosphorylase/glucosamine-1-phosphate N-acetyltransferase
LAAGLGKRMRSPLPKVLHTVGGVPMLLHVLEAARAVPAERLVVVLGHGHEQVEPILPAGVQVALQERQSGTGHALLCAASHLLPGPCLVLCGDTPLVRGETLAGLVEAHRRSRAAATVLTMEPPDPTGYGRVVRAADGSLLRIVEDRDATPEERTLREVNGGVYVLPIPLALDLLRQARPENAQKEIYLTDVIALLRERGCEVGAHKVAEAAELQGVNSPEELAEVERLMTARGRREKADAEPARVVPYEMEC